MGIMDITQFTEHKTGRLVESDHPRVDWAFLPNHLPPVFSGAEGEKPWELPRYLWPLLVTARESLGKLDGIGQVLPSSDLLLNPLQRREAIASSRIEGTYVTPEELLLFEVNPVEGKSSRVADWVEVNNYREALIIGSKMLRQGQAIGSNILRTMHKVLLQGVRGQDCSPGEYREQQVQIGSSGRYIPPPSMHIVDLMQNLGDYISAPLSTPTASVATGTTIDPLVKSFISHYQFEAIHPFLDGNGRVGRALLALMICQDLGHQQPWLYLSEFFDRYRDEYIKYLFEVSTQGAWGTWIEYCLRATIAQADDSILRCQHLNEIRKKFLAILKDSPRTSRSLVIVEELFTGEFLTIPIIASRFNVTYRTAQKDIERLIDIGILDELVGHRPKTFYSPEIIRIAYKDASYN